jgi:hypothetical protein
MLRAGSAKLFSHQTRQARNLRRQTAIRMRSETLVAIVWIVAEAQAKVLVEVPATLLPPERLPSPVSPAGRPNHITEKEQ